MFQAVQKVNGKVLWANTHLLFWLSLVPFSTGWMGEHNMASGPVLLYGINLLMCALAYTVLTKTLIAHHGPKSTLANAIGSDKKGILSMGLYIAAVAIAFWLPLVSYILYATVAFIWLIPDTRIEHKLETV